MHSKRSNKYINCIDLSSKHTIQKSLKTKFKYLYDSSANQRGSNSFHSPRAVIESLFSHNSRQTLFVYSGGEKLCRESFPGVGLFTTLEFPICTASPFGNLFISDQIGRFSSKSSAVSLLRNASLLVWMRDEMSCGTSSSSSMAKAPKSSFIHPQPLALLLTTNRRIDRKVSSGTVCAMVWLWLCVYQ